MKHVEQVFLAALSRDSESCIPFFQHHPQLVSQRGKTAKLFLEIIQFCSSERPNLHAGSPAFLPNLQEPRQLIQGEPDGERVPHKPNAVWGLRGIFAIPVGGAPRMQEAVS